MFSFFRNDTRNFILVSINIKNETLGFGLLDFKYTLLCLLRQKTMTYVSVAVNR